MTQNVQAPEGDNQSQLPGKVRQILLHVWDPLKIRDDPNRQDAYEKYVPQLVALMEIGTPQPELEHYLFRFETLELEVNNGDQALRKEASRQLGELATPKKG